MTQRVTQIWRHFLHLICSAFAQAVGSQAKEIDGKVCAKKLAQGQKDVAGAGRWSCTDVPASNSGGTTPTEPGAVNATFSSRFNTLEGHVPTAQSGTGTSTVVAKGWPGTATGNTSTADDMAKDLRDLGKDEKRRVAGLLSKTISSAEACDLCVDPVMSYCLPALKPSH